MCGLFGANFADTKIHSAKKALFLHTLSRLSDKSGGQSWGICTLDQDGQAIINKGFGYISDSTLKLLKQNMFFAHTRFATHGKITLDNAHPFKIDHIIGSHNGVLNNHADLNIKYNRKHEVDSQHLFSHIANNLDMTDILGYGVITWHDTNKTGKIFLCNLQGGSLSIASFTDKQNNQGLAWSSEKSHLKQAFKSAHIRNYSFYEVEQGQVYYTNKNDGVLWFSEDQKLMISKPQSKLDWRDGLNATMKATNTLKVIESLNSGLCDWDDKEWYNMKQTVVNDELDELALNDWLQNNDQEMLKGT